ncbi:MAG: 3-oxoacyl-ACP reductase family protein [Dehalococcoidia bacterium]|nr:3-oxoacyl-ACP reductase family protein [Dehalococcoidia bacterium]
MRLEGRVAIVTGGARGMGKTFCLKMAEEGAKVVVADVLDREAKQTAKEIQSKGGEALAVQTDVSSEVDTQRMANKAVEAFGGIDILVNNAGMLAGLTRKPFTEIPLEEWDKVIAVNVKGVLLCCRAVFSQMKKQGNGKIINISSNAFFGGSPNSVHYVTSKAGVIAITRCLANEVAQYGICVNSVAPGVVETEATRDLTELRKVTLANTPLGRLAQTGDVAGAIIFFASDDSNFVTGQTLIVDGGRRMH